jgi:hypothetical protein
MYLHIFLRRSRPFGVILEFRCQSIFELDFFVCARSIVPLSGQRRFACANSLSERIESSMGRMYVSMGQCVDECVCINVLVHDSQSMHLFIFLSGDVSSIDVYVHARIYAPGGIIELWNYVFPSQSLTLLIIRT